MAKKAKEITLTPEVSLKLSQWLDAQAQLSSVKSTEFELRQSVVREAGFEVNKFEGSETISIGNGYKLKATKVQNYTMANDQSQTVNLLNEIGKHRVDLAVGLIKWTPDLSTRTYKELLDWLKELEKENKEAATAIKTLLAAALTVKPGTAQLELIAPKKEDEKEAEA